MERSDSLFSLCGLNCGLCPMNLREMCGGCFTVSPCYEGCPIFRCAERHKGVEYCFQCSKYPCRRNDGIDLHDSLISHRNQKRDLAEAGRIGIDAYLAVQQKKREILTRLLSDFDDGRRDVFFALAVNMLPLDELVPILERAERDCISLPISKRRIYVEKLLRECGKRFDIPLELRY